MGCEFALQFVGPSLAASHASPASTSAIRDAKSQVATGVTVTKINFEGKRADSVNVDFNGDPFTIKANRGVLMAAGAIYTPQLLQISGIGAEELLGQLGVPMVTNLPVGQNFIDRLTWVVQIAAKEKIDKYLGYTVAVNTSAGMTFESVGGQGVDSQMGIASLGLAPAKHRSQFLFPFMKWLMNDTPIGALVDHMSNILALMHDPKSRGSVEAVSLDAFVPPRVTANFFAEEEDLDKQVEILKANIEIAKQAPLEPWRMKSLLEPLNWQIDDEHMDMLREAGLNETGPEGLPDFLSGLLTCQAYGFLSVPCPPKDENKWPQWLRDNVLSTYHYFGTAAVGPVLESGSFKVRDVEGLYVVDASAIPRATRINPVGTIMTLGHYVGSRLAKSARVQMFV